MTKKKEVSKKEKAKSTYVCDKCGSVSEEKNCVCCNRH